MNEPLNLQPKPSESELSPEEIARARMNRPYPRRVIPRVQVLGLLDALNAEKTRNQAFGANDLKPFMERYRASQPVHYRAADGTEIILMPDEFS